MEIFKNINLNFFFQFYIRYVFYSFNNCYISFSIYYNKVNYINLNHFCYKNYVYNDVNSINVFIDNLFFGKVNNHVNNDSILYSFFNIYTINLNIMVLYPFIILFNKFLIWFFILFVLFIKLLKT